MALSYIQTDQDDQNDYDDQHDGSTISTSDKTVVQSDRADDTDSVIAPSIAYSTLRGAFHTQLGAGLFDTTNDEDNIDKDLREALETLDDGGAQDALSPNGFMHLLLNRDGPIVDYLTDGQYSSCHEDLEIVVQKNLILVLQAHVLLEDCLQKEEGENKNDVSKKNLVVCSALQKMVGIPYRRKKDCTTVISLLSTYAKAREQEILCFAIIGEEPPLPTTALNALLLMLMDRFIVFKLTRKAIRSKRDVLPLRERLEERSRTMERAIQVIKNNIGEEESTSLKPVGLHNTVENVRKESQPGMWTHMGALVPSNELELSYPKPWFAEEWLSKHVPKESWPQVVKKVRIYQSGANPRSQQAIHTDEPESTSEQTQNAQRSNGHGKDASNKRKRDEDEDSESQHGNKALRVEAETKNLYYTMENLVYRPKV